MNLSIKKIMKTNKQIWYTLEIFGDYNNRETLISYFDKIIVGSEIKGDSSILYFDNTCQNEVDTFLIKNKLVEKWIWSETIEENWNKTCEDFFKPILINNKINILPYWEEQRANCLNIIINPALAFGTGHHETTYMMIKGLLEFDFDNKTVFDIGTGSGILSIIAKKLGAKKIKAIDNDSLTHNNFYENLKLNSLNKNDIDFEIKDCFKVKDFNYDFIFANISSTILQSLVSKINKQNCTLIISGILDTDEKSIDKVLNENNKKIKKRYQKNEWLCFVIEL